MTRFLKIYLCCFMLVILSGCKAESISSTDPLSYHHHDRSLKNQNPTKTDSPNLLNTSFSYSNELYSKNLRARSTDNSSSGLSWDIDKDGVADALTDGLLLLRYTFGLTGESLVVGAVSENSALSSTEIEAEIAQILSISDIDGDGTVDALTDSLILLRYLFGLTDESLIVGSISTAATRTSSVAIEAYIANYLPGNSSTPQTVNISGNITFDLIPFYQFSNGLDMGNTYASAARGVVVAALDNSDNVIATTTTDNNGNYSLVTQSNLELRVRVSARMLNTNGTPWDVQVFDNTTSTGGGNPLYVTDSSTFVTSGDAVKNIHLPAGRNGDNGGIRSAAPFAILDVIYQSMQKTATVDPTIEFPSLEIFWSPKNNTSSGSTEDGDLGSSFFQRPNQIYILGDENSDSDEYDRHVIAHEWIHYFEHNFSRSDSLGGAHGVDDKLDLRVAYSEGMANAVSGIILEDSVYRDSDSFWPYFGWSMDMESNDSYNPGWFNEGSVQSIIYDLYDNNADGADNIALGFGPIVNTLTSSGYVNDDYPISIFSFTQYLKNQQSAENITQINSLISAQQIYGTGSNGAGETNSGGITSVLPIYREIFTNSASQQVCYDNNSGVLNKLGNRSLLVFDVPVAGIYNIALTPAATASASLDADLAIFKQGVTIGRDYSLNYNGRANLFVSLTTGKHIIESGVWDPDQTAPLGNYCFNIAVTN